MASFWYGKALARATAGGLGYISGNVKVAFVDARVAHYVPNSATDEFLAIISSGDIIARSPNLSTKTNALGVLDADDPVFTAVTGANVSAFVVYRDTGSDATSELIIFCDSIASFTPAGTDVTLNFFNGTGKMAEI